MKKNLMKKAVATGLVLTMVMGGASAAFAKGNDHDDRGKGNNNNSYTTSINNGKNNNGKISGNIQIRINFDDLKGAQWAMRYIASLASKQVFEGYEDGTFKPDKSVSRIEAITAAVRLMGLREQAESATEMATKLNFKDADKIPAWAVGYVAVALENDLFTESDDSVQPNKEADRLWATTLLVKALKLESEAKAKMNTQLTFKDAKQIPAGSVGYVAVAIEKGLVDGFEDNTFKPNQNVTRAQLAALLDRTGNQMPDDQNSTAGTVNAAVYNNVLPVTKAGVTTNYVLHPDAFILRNGVKVAASAIQVGDEVKVRSFNNQVVFVEVTKMADANQSFDVVGTLNSTTVDGQGKITSISITQTINGVSQTTIYNVAANVALTGNLGNFTPTHVVELKGQNQVVTTIDVK
ncbi:S-layer homology domain-containing protein [Paenibacillus sp. CGMCC 1.16610]|uniref:S-layer homology domain-containing protein n=1 Tax=Paenibacillus anseongense TaxID=2682845 RepID=A0ABW9UJX1_9BACL|nr:MULTISPECIES: S-layer homology domain-containing protein [Paenibacillus]MBA2943485.1 S-layer homology domain-containing protein [Paenibacillus sp. CGMCC 1.16610]MVQ40464.1 S-layer homology domain-containing protein [Paenibacillus anseongense]